MSAVDDIFAREIKALRDRVAALEAIEIPISTKGAWTPEFTGTGTAGTFTYTLQVGTWTRDGNRLSVDGHVGISAIGVAPTGNMRIKNLPFNAVTLANYVAGCSWSVIDNFNYTGTAFQLLGFVQSNSIVLDLFESFDNAGFVAVPAANFTNVACRLGFSIVYQLP